MLGKTLCISWIHACLFSDFVILQVAYGNKWPRRTVGTIHQPLRDSEEDNEEDVGFTKVSRPVMPIIRDGCSNEGGVGVSLAGQRETSDKD